MEQRGWTRGAWTRRTAATGSGTRMGSHPRATMRPCLHSGTTETSPASELCSNHQVPRSIQQRVLCKKPLTQSAQPQVRMTTAQFRWSATSAEHRPGAYPHTAHAHTPKPRPGASPTGPLRGCGRHRPRRTRRGRTPRTDPPGLGGRTHPTPQPPTTSPQTSTCHAIRWVGQIQRRRIHHFLGSSKSAKAVHTSGSHSSHSI